MCVNQFLDSSVMDINYWLPIMQEDGLALSTCMHMRGCVCAHMHVPSFQPSIKLNRYSIFTLLWLYKYYSLLSYLLHDDHISSFVQLFIFSGVSDSLIFFICIVFYIPVCISMYPPTYISVLGLVYWLLCIPASRRHMWCSGWLGFGVWLLEFATSTPWSFLLCLSLSTCKMEMIVLTHHIDERIRWNTTCKTPDTWYQLRKCLFYYFHC